jgi:hypothetical protein
MGIDNPPGMPPSVLWIRVAVQTWWVCPLITYPTGSTARSTKATTTFLVAANLLTAEEKALKEQVKANKKIEREQKKANKAQIKADKILAKELAKAQKP